MKISADDTVVHEQFGEGRVLSADGGHLKVIFTGDEHYKIVTGEFIKTVNGKVTHFRNTSKINPKAGPSKKNRILDLLTDAGQVGVNSRELLPITHRFSAVIFLLRNEGYQIQTKMNTDGSSTLILEAQ